MKDPTRLAIVGLWCALHAAAQGAGELRQSVSRYALSRQSAPASFVLSPEQAAERLRGSDKPLIVDLRPAGDFAKLRLKGSQRRGLQELFTPDVLERLPSSRPILVVDDGSYQAVEAMVLLRLLGRQVFAIQGDVQSVAQQVSAKAKVAPAAGGGVADIVEGATAADAEKMPPDAANPATGANPAAPPPAAPLPRWVIGVIGGLVLLVGGVVLWFAVLQPRRRARPLLDAIHLLAGGSDESLAQAEALLNRALNAGLREQDLRQTRFLLAYVKARLGQCAEAILVLKDADDASLEALYLQLWLTVKEKRWEEAERICYQHINQLADFLRARELAGIAYLELARKAMGGKQYDRALEYFQKVQRLGVHKDQVPEHLADLELVLAMNALFEGQSRVADAAERFGLARKSAEAAGQSSLLPRIGLLLCEWKSQDRPNLDRQLSALLDEVKASAAQGGGKSEAAELLPILALWYTVSLLYDWLRRLPEKKGLPAAERQNLAERLAFTREQMPKQGDAQLIGGLVDYYCARDERQRLAAVDELRAAIDLGVTLPEVLYLVQCEDRLAELSKNRFDSYLTLLRGFLSDPSITMDLRKELQQHLAKFERFRPVGEISIVDESAVAPSLHDVAASCELIEERMQRIFRGYTDDGKRSVVENLLGGLRKSREELHRTVGELGKTEQKLMRVAGETLLPEEAEAV
jgi:rhodanese-related sulfurtransferase